MRATGKSWQCILVLMVLGTLAACAASPVGSYYNVSEVGPPSSPPESLDVGADDRTFILSVDDRTPFGLRQLPLSEDRLYDMGYDHVRRKREADFAIDVVLSASGRDNPDVRGANMLGGALFGAAAGAVIGEVASGNPGAGAAIGAASGGALGLAAPASTPLVRIDLHVQSFREDTRSHRSRVVDLASVPPHDVQQVIDNEVSRMLSTLPRR